LHFGDFCEVYNEMDNMSRSRSVPCIALYLCNNMAGSCAYMNLASKKIIRRLQWVKMVSTDKIVSRMSMFDPEEAGPQHAEQTMPLGTEKRQGEEAQATTAEETEVGTVVGVLEAAPKPVSPETDENEFE